MAREVVLHEHLLELGLAKFVEGARDGYLFLRAKTKVEAKGRLRASKNRMQAHVREIVPDKGVQPNHGWRYTFKHLGRSAESIGARLMSFKAMQAGTCLTPTTTCRSSKSLRPSRSCPSIP